MYPCFTSSENAHVDAKAIIATITPRFTLLDFHVESFSMGLLNGKLVSLDLLNVGSSSVTLSDEPRLIWEALCTDIVLKGDIPGAVTCLLLEHLRHVQEPVLAISAAKPRFLILCLLSWTHEVSRLDSQTCGRKIMFWSCGMHPASQDNFGLKKSFRFKATSKQSPQTDDASSITPSI